MTSQRVLESATTLATSALMGTEGNWRRVGFVVLTYVYVAAGVLWTTVAYGESQQESFRQHTLGLIKQLMASRSAGALPRLVQADVPAVGCPRDGQTGLLDAPKLPQTVRVLVADGAQNSLALYSASEEVESGILAPRGWHCFETYGSNGSTLYVTPRDLAGPILDRPKKAVSGPIVIRSMRFGDTSGRFAVARISARVFPAARGFVDHVRREEISRGDVYHFEPWPGDRIARLYARTVSYVTPATRRGLGTELGAVPTSDLISGLAVLTGALNGDGDGLVLEGLAVRLGSSREKLSIAIAVAMLAAVAAE